MAILNTKLPEDMRQPLALPGTRPLDPAQWLQVNEAYAPQISEKARLLRDTPAQVLAHAPSLPHIAEEALAVCVAALGDMPMFEVGETWVKRPDGEIVSLVQDPLLALGALLQEDICLLHRAPGEREHKLCAALVCFPANWRLAEKLGHPITHIHTTVDSYDANIATRVQRLLDGVQIGRPIWRFNQVWYETADLFQPERLSELQVSERVGGFPFFRCERQSFVRLPKSGAIMFTIHTYVLERAQAMQFI
jgi:hypothetical protein